MTGAMSSPFTLRLPSPLPVVEVEGRRVVRTDGIDVPVTNLDKVYWPPDPAGGTDAITKGDLLTYYWNVAPVIVPHLHDRPLTLRRLPDGIAGPTFFQRNAPDWTPDWVPLCAIEPADSKVDETVVVHNRAHLLFVANLGAIEMHPLHSRCVRYDQPDHLVLDLDPMEPAAFDEALVIAHQLKVVLDHLGLRGYPKTSGATGVQVFVPVEDKHSYEETRTLAEAMGALVVQTASDLATMEWSIGKRKGKVFIDHKMNRRAASLASVYSARPRPGGTVSAPITWDEVAERAVRPSDFTMESIFERLATFGDLFEPVITQPQDLDDALRTLGVRASRADISQGRVRAHVTERKRTRRG
jgi:bifunctional non-homologous end joining protein LigD